LVEVALFQIHQLYFENFMKILNRFALISLLALSGCVGPDGTRTIPGLGPKAKAIRTDDLMITLSRTECYGTCPVYELAIESDGSVTFNGKKHTKTLGKANGTIESGQLDRLLKEFNSLGYLDLNEVYDEKTCPSYATDMSTVRTSIRQNGKTKFISHYLGCSEKGGDNKPYPPGLTELERSIDAAARSEQWITGSN
jgi:hypothetical protein